jgi:putative hydrolase of the HAD superfamily
MNEKHIKNLVFDFGNVLVNLDKQRCVKHFEELGLHKVDELINNSFKEGFFQNYELGLISTGEFREHIRSLTNKKLKDEAIDAAWNSFLVTIPPRKLMLLLELRKRYMVYLLSNTNELHWQWSCDKLFPYKGFDVNSYFEKTYLSFEMKLSKPDAKIFQTMIEDSGIDPEETLFIDDSVDNCLAAETLGIRSFVAESNEDWTRLFDNKK